MIAVWDPHRQANKNHFHRRSQRGVAATTKDTKTDQELGFPSRSLEGPSASVTFRDVGLLPSSLKITTPERNLARLHRFPNLCLLCYLLFKFSLLSSVRAHPITESPARSETGPYAGCSRQGDRPGIPASPHEPLPCPSRRPDGSNRALDCRGRRDRARCDRD
jgi:hypothetical protein